MAYTGKTKEGSKISFVLSGGKVSRIRTMIPTSCASGQGGDPKAGLDVFQPPGGFASRKAEKQDTAMTCYHVTKNYAVTRHRAGGRISGELAVTWSWVDVSVQDLHLPGQRTLQRQETLSAGIGGAMRGTGPLRRGARPAAVLLALPMKGGVSAEVPTTPLWTRGRRHEFRGRRLRKSRIAQARLLVLVTPVAEVRAYAERGPRPGAWCF